MIFLCGVYVLKWKVSIFCGQGNRSVPIYCGWSHAGSNINKIVYVDLYTLPHYYESESNHKHFIYRSYFRCTHKFESGCLATKQVQKSDDDPAIFDVTYYGVHTCQAGALASKPNSLEKQE